MKVLAYLLCSVPAAIGVWFLADAAHSTSDSGAAGAAQLGLIAAAAYVGPLLALIVWRNGYKVASAVLWLLTAGAMVANLSQTLDALANRGAGKNAEAAKLAVTVRTDRATLKRLSDERQAMRFAAADADAVRAAQAAVTSAEAIRVRECGNGDPKQRGPNCRTRESEEQAKRDGLAAVLANKALTDQATKLDAEIARVTARLDKAPPVRETHSGNLFASIFSLSPITAASYQQQVFAALIEAIIAASLCLPELLRKAERSAPAAVPVVRPPTVVKVLGDILQPGAARARVELTDVRASYLAACQALGVKPADADTFVDQAKAFAEATGIRIMSSGGKVWWCGVKLAA